MDSCPFCNAELSEAAHATRRCPVCDTVLDWDQPDVDTLPPLPSPGKQGPAQPNARAHLRTMVDRTEADEAAAREQATQPSDPQAPSADKPSGPRELSESDFTLAFAESGEPPRMPGLDTDATGVTLDVDELPPDRVDMLTGIWSATVAPDSKPGMTIKAAAAGSASQTHLVVRPRTLRPQNEPAPDGADYELLEIIGKGGMGVVYSARQASIDRTVAIKMIRRDMATDTDQRQKFLSEAVVTGDLDHPNIVPIYDLGANEAGALFYSMKRVQGTPWMNVIRSKSQDENLEILMKVADAVAFAHSRGVVHRDLKPENVMLGEFGEVLVMDWGLALLAPRFQHHGTVTQSGGMGGTPAYMAPEMASGPLERIGTASDIYLLGAILFEVITGKPPHAGKDVMSCLHAVARNQIQPTDKSGELMDIALMAMATEPEDRYETALDFQAAIRQYYSHSESILLSSRADEDLAQAQQSKDYQDFARSVFGFQEALELWDGNERAHHKIPRAKLAYAQCAMAKGDLDLAASLLDADEELFGDLRRQIAAAQRERDARQQRLKYFVRVARALVATVIIVVTGAFFLIRGQRDRAVSAEQEAVASEREATIQRDRAVVAEQDATDQAKRAMEAEKVAEKDRDTAVAAEQEATSARKRAEEAEDEATIDRDKALMAREAEEKARMQAVAAREAEEKLRLQKEYDAYIAQIGLVSAKIDENSFGYAAQLLDECKPELRHWEWGRLMHLCRQSAQSYSEAGPIEAACYAPDGKRLATGSWEGTAHIWDVETGKQLVTIKHGMYVHAVAFSPDGKWLATGSDDDTGEVRIWDAETGQLRKTLADHADSAISVAFSRDGKRLLTGSYDNTARLWDIESGQELRAFKGHTWWVWAASFSPDESKIVTASQDGSAIVWSVASEEKSAPFTGHVGPVYTAVFSPDGRHVATGGYDKQILIWRPEQVRAFDYSTIVGAQRPARPEYLSLAGHTAPVRCARFSPDGKTLLSASHDNTVKLWELASATCTHTLRGHAGWVRACSFAPDGKAVLSAGYDHQAKIWKPEQYEEVRTLRGHEDAVLSASFSPDGGRIVTGGRDRTARIWDAATGAETMLLREGHAFLVSSVAISPDGQKVFTGAGDGTVRAWDIATGGQLFKLDDTGRSGVLALSTDGTRVLTSAGEKNARYWDAATGRLVAELVGHRSEVTAVAVSLDGQLLYTGDSKGRGKIWDAATGKELRNLEGHSRKIIAAAFLAGGKRVLTASIDNTVGQWDVATGQEHIALVLKHPDSVAALAVSADGKLALTACADKRIRLWNVDRAQVIRQVDAGECALSSVAFSPDGRRALAACTDDIVRLWDLATGAEIAGAGGKKPHAPFLDAGRRAVWTAVFSPDGSHVATAGGNDAKLWHVASGREVMTYSPHGAVASANFSPDGQRVATASWDGTVKLWSAATGKAEMKFTAAQDKYVNSIAFSPDGTRLLSASDDRTAKIWDATTGKLLVSLPHEGEDGHSEAVRSARYSPDGRRIVTASADKTARVWDAETGAVLAVLEGHDWAVQAAAFSSDGKRIMTGGEDNRAIIWNAETGQQLLVLVGHTASVTSVAFSPDGGRGATGGQDNAVKLWDAITGKEVLHLKQHAQEVSAVSFSPDGKSLLTGSRDGTGIVWPAVDWQ